MLVKRNGKVIGHVEDKKVGGTYAMFIEGSYVGECDEIKEGVLKVTAIWERRFKERLV